GKVYYDAVGQVFNPDGQSYDEAAWNNTSVYNPVKKTWTDVGTPTLGFRGSTFSMMLPLQPPYTKASFLTAGGIVGVTPGTYVAVPFGQIDTVDTAHNDAFSSVMTGSLNDPRWYSTGVLLPTGQVMAFSGADRDEVVDPGSGFPVKQAELYDPATGTWSPMAVASHGRTYHNTAALLPDGRILVGGHAPIPNGYGSMMTTPGGFSNGSRDPTFEIYSPPYLFWGSRPTITSAPRSAAYGRPITIGTPDAANIDNVVLVRNTAITHLTDGDQREVTLRIVSRTGSSITVAGPPNGAVAPPGPYMLFVNAKSSRGLIPSVSREVFVG
ncbi:MAG TPA: galactose oxidase early set domain-containing protein, partial [Mycobacteriales bacterium]|nr:galactose oxidase early set domain-containing protein [Mycobacteriales bacterium]